MPKSVLWRRLDAPSFEVCHFDADNLLLRGHVLSGVGAAPRRVAYEVRCGADWRTSDVQVEITTGATVSSMTLTRDQSGRWRTTEHDLPEFDDVFDVDLGFTPATNTLPIRRLQLTIGERASVAALWVRFPDLALQRLSQVYSRLDEDRYLYESNAGAFRAELRVDANGLVVQYEKLFEVLAALED